MGFACWGRLPEAREVDRGLRSWGLCLLGKVTRGGEGKPRLGGNHRIASQSHPYLPHFQTRHLSDVLEHTKSTYVDLQTWLSGRAHAEQCRGEPETRATMKRTNPEEGRREKARRAGAQLPTSAAQLEGQQSEKGEGALTEPGYKAEPAPQSFHLSYKSSHHEAGHSLVRCCKQLPHSPSCQGWECQQASSLRVS